jgi:hypothetical protein
MHTTSSRCVISVGIALAKAARVMTATKVVNLKIILYLKVESEQVGFVVLKKNEEGMLVPEFL